MNPYDPLEEIRRRLMGMPAIAEPTVSSPRSVDQYVKPKDYLHDLELLKVGGVREELAAERLLNHPFLRPEQKVQMANPSLDFPSQDMLTQGSPKSAPWHSYTGGSMAPQGMQKPSVYGTAPTSSGAGLDKFSPEVAAFLANNPPKKPKPASNLIAAVQRTMQGQGFPANGRVSGFGNMLGEGLGEGAQAQIAKTQANNVRRGMTASQKRQVDTPQQPAGPISQALADQMPFGNTTDKMARAANNVAPGVTARQTKDGTWQVLGPYATEDRVKAGEYERRKYAKSGTISAEQERDAKRAALQRTKLKAKRGGVLMAGADASSSLAEIQSAEKEIEKRIANKKAGLPEDTGIGGPGGNAVAAKQDPLSAGISAVEKAKAAKIAATKNKFAKLTDAEGAAAFNAGMKARETEIANEAEMTRQKAVFDAQESVAKAGRELQERLAKDQLAATREEGGLSRAQAKELAEADRTARAQEAEKQFESFDNRDKNQYIRELSQFYVEKGDDEDTAAAKAVASWERTKGGGPPRDTIPVSFDPVKTGQKVGTDLATPGSKINAVLTSLGLDPKTLGAGNLGRAIMKRMESAMPMTPEDLNALREFAVSKGPEFANVKKVVGGDPVGRFVVDELVNNPTGPDQVKRAKERQQAAEDAFMDSIGIGSPRTRPKNPLSPF